MRTLLLRALLLWTLLPRLTEVGDSNTENSEPSRMRQHILYLRLFFFMADSTPLLSFSCMHIQALMLMSYYSCVYYW